MRASGFSTLIWLQWKRFRSNAAYGLTLIGFERGSNSIYKLYIAIFWLIWLGMMWIFAISQVYQISQLFSADEALELQIVIPPLVFAAQLFYLIRVLRHSPIKLGAGDIAYVAASPVSRTAVIFIHFIRSLLLPLAVVGVVGCLVAMLLTWPLSPALAGFAGLQGMLLGWLLFLFTAALVWPLAIVKMWLWYPWLMWVIVPVAFVLAVFLPQIMFYPGDVWLYAVNAQLVVPTVLILLGLISLALCLLAVVASRVNMAKVVADSWTYARIQKLGIFAKLYSDDLTTSIQRQSQLLRKKRLRLTISDRASGYTVIWNRALLSLFRFAPGSLFRPFFRGMALTASAAFIIRLSGGQHLQTWILLLLLFIFWRPSELNTYFQQDVGQAFTRQFLPGNLLLVALADSAVPILLASLGGVFVLAFQPLFDFWTGVVLVFSLFTTLEFCLILEQVVVSGPIYRRVPYAYSVVFSGIVLVVVGFLFRDLLTVAVAAVSLNILFATALYTGSIRGD